MPKVTCCACQGFHSNYTRQDAKNFFYKSSAFGVIGALAVKSNTGSSFGVIHFQNVDIFPLLLYFTCIKDQDFTLGPFLNEDADCEEKVDACRQVSALSR